MDYRKRLADIGRHAIKCRMPPKRMPTSYVEFSAEVPEKLSSAPMRYKYRFYVEAGCEFTSEVTSDVEIANRGAALLQRELYGSIAAQLSDIQNTMYAEDNEDTEACRMLEALRDSLTNSRP